MKNFENCLENCFARFARNVFDFLGKPFFRKGFDDFWEIFRAPRDFPRKCSNIVQRCSGDSETFSKTTSGNTFLKHFRTIVMPNIFQSFSKYIFCRNVATYIPEQFSKTCLGLFFETFCKTSSNIRKCYCDVWGCFKMFFGNVHHIVYRMGCNCFGNVLKLFGDFCNHSRKCVEMPLAWLSLNVLEMTPIMFGKHSVLWLNVFASISVCGVVTHPAKTLPRRASRADFPSFLRNIVKAWKKISRRASRAENSQ